MIDMNLVILYLGAGVAIGFAAGAAFAGAMICSHPMRRKAMAQAMISLVQQRQNAH